MLFRSKDAVYDEGDLLPVYMHGKGTREDPCYFDEELPSEDNVNDEEMEVNKIDEENKENILGGTSLERKTRSRLGG